MISVSDLICLPYAPDLTEAGIRYACRSLPHTFDRMGGSPYDRLRRIVVGTAVELAFRRYLSKEGVPFDIKGATPFTEPDRYDVSLGGHRCDIKSFLISYREQITSLHAHPEQLLQAPALVPLDQHVSDEGRPSDLYLFVFLTGLVAASPEDVQKAGRAGNPLFLIHALPASWVRPQVWTPLGPLALKSECEEEIALEVGGQDASQAFITREIALPSRRRVELDFDYYSLAYVHARSRPQARIGVRSLSRRETHVIQPTDWGNIWVYGMRFYLAGWTTREEFRRRARLLQPGSRVFQYDHTRTKNLALPVGDLRSLPELLARARAWAELRDPEGSSAGW